MWRWIGLLLLPLLAACASHAPAPVVERGAPPPAKPAAAVAAETGAGYYTVKKGDTLYSIALDHGHDYKDIAAWNSLDNPNVIKVGQQLRVAPPEAAAPVAVAKPVAAATVVEGKPLEPGAAKPASSNTDTLKREPRGGTVAYSDQALAQAQAMAGGPAAAEKPAEKPADKPAEKPVVAAAAGEGAIDWAWPAAGQVIAPFVEAAPGKESNKGIDIGGNLGDPVLAGGSGTVTYVGYLRGYGNFIVLRHNASYLSVYAHINKALVTEEKKVARGQKIAEMGNSDATKPMLHFEIRRMGTPLDPLKFLPAR